MLHLLPWLLACSPTLMDVEPPPKPDPSNSLFLQDALLEIHVDLQEADLDSMMLESQSLGEVLGGDCLNEPAEPSFTWFDANISLHGLVFEARVRQGGFLEESHPTRPSLLVDLDPENEGTRHRGLRHLRLSSERKDPTRQASCLSLGVARDAEQIAPRCGLVALWLNGQAMGVYAHIEALDEVFLEKHFQDSQLPIWTGQLADFRGDLQTRFAPGNEAAQNRKNPFEALTETLTELENVSTLSTWLDVEQFAGFWATERFLLKENAYSSNGRAFSLVESPEGSLLFIPEGSALSMGLAEEAEIPLDLTASALPWALLQLEEGRELFQRALEQLTASFNPQEVERRLQEMTDVALPVEQATGNEDFVAAHATLKHFIATRQAEVEAALQGGPEAPQVHMDEPVCLETIGFLEADFHTSWGSLESSDPFHAGDAWLEFEIHGEARRLENIGGVAGPNHAGGALVGVAAWIEDQEGLLALVAMPEAWWKDNTQVKFDFDEVIGTLSRTSVDTGWEWESIAWMDAGFLQISSAGSAIGDPVVGRMEAELLYWAQ